MPKCPVCDTNYAEELTTCCGVCSWEFAPDQGPLDGSISSADGQQSRSQLIWARQMWTTLQQLATQLSQEKKGKKKKRGKHKKQKSFLPPPTTNSQLEARFDELQRQLQEATVQRTYLQTQLEWVLYRLEQMNPEQIGDTLSRLEEAIATLPAATPPMSEVGIDYNPLMQLLAAGKWQKADELTWALVLKAKLREEEGWLTELDMTSFPCTDFSTIDQLWEYYSGGKFGLSTQYRIWESVGGHYTEFCDRVGWRAKDNWKYYEELSFHLNAPEGHLPVLAWRRRSCYGPGQLIAAESFSVLASRLLVCQGKVTSDNGSY